MCTHLDESFLDVTTSIPLELAIPENVYHKRLTVAHVARSRLLFHALQFFCHISPSLVDYFATHCAYSDPNVGPMNTFEPQFLCPHISLRLEREPGSLFSLISNTRFNQPNLTGPTLKDQLKGIGVVEHVWHETRVKH